jgi:competence protein ComFC
MIKGSFKSFINLLYPLKCRICKRKLHPENTWHMCKDCLHKIYLNLPPYCRVCGRNINLTVPEKQICKQCLNNDIHFDRAWAVCKYKDPIKKCIHLFKYNRNISLVNLLSELAGNYIERFININKIDSVLAVPIHKSKLRQKGFNHSQLIVESIAKRFNKPVSSNNLIKSKATTEQVNLNKQKRLSNLKNSFKVKNLSLLKNKTVLLIDDVYTTGSTINECAKTLKGAEVNKVYALVLARGN